jgi:hypothetical protein
MRHVCARIAHYVFVALLEFGIHVEQRAKRDALVAKGEVVCCFVVIAYTRFVLRMQQAGNTIFLLELEASEPMV